MRRHPAFAPYEPWLRGTPLVPVPLDVLNRWARDAALELDDGTPLAFVPATRVQSALAYERRIAQRGEIGIREGDLHDFCNALAWLALPRTKRALNARHCRSGAAPTPNARDRTRDAATLLDESGLIVACARDDLLAAWDARDWGGLFAVRRRDVEAHLRAIAIGHGLLAKLRVPFRAITGKALVIRIDADVRTSLRQLDHAAAEAIGSGSFAPSALRPLPIAALPGWDVEELGAALFDDAAVFRTRVTAGSACAAGADNGRVRR